MNVDSTLASGGISGVIVVIAILLFKYLNKHKCNIISGCCKIKIEEDRTPPSDLRIKAPIEEKV
jgi:hypothetical protein